MYYEYFQVGDNICHKVNFSRTIPDLRCCSILAMLLAIPLEILKPMYGKGIG
jgi:hypothetical protein